MLSTVSICGLLTVVIFSVVISSASASYKDDVLEIERKKQLIRRSFLHSWNGYVSHAGYHHDELRPVSNSHYNWMELSISTVSALDTLWVMGFKEEFGRAREFIRDELDFDKNLNVSLFETTIRVVGGLLGAYELSKDELFLTKAKDLADRLLWAFNISESGIPYPSINLQTHEGAPTWGEKVTTLAEIGSLQLEFNYLSHHLKNPIYAEKVSHISDHLDFLNPPYGLYPLHYNLTSGDITYYYGYVVTLGGLADSFYEYLLKQWLQTGKKDDNLRIQYDEAVEGMYKLLFRQSVNKPGSIYVTQYITSNYSQIMDHLTCFLPGMLALGAHGETAGRDMWLAEELLATCYDMYACSATGLAPESVHFLEGADFIVKDPKNLLRPETIESILYLWRITKNPKYRAWGWSIFESLEKYAKTHSGYSGLLDVRDRTSGLTHEGLDDIMPAYFLSETMKYLFLLFDYSLPLDEYVLNTEAHPLRIFDT